MQYFNRIQTCVAIKPFKSMEIARECRLFVTLPGLGSHAGGLQLPISSANDAVCKVQCSVGECVHVFLLEHSLSQRE